MNKFNKSFKTYKSNKLITCKNLICTFVGPWNSELRIVVERREKEFIRNESSGNPLTKPERQGVM